MRRRESAGSLRFVSLIFSDVSDCSCRVMREILSQSGNSMFPANSSLTMFGTNCVNSPIDPGLEIFMSLRETTVKSFSFDFSQNALHPDKLHFFISNN